MAKLIALLFLVSCIFIISPTTQATKKSSWFQNICSGTHEKVAKVHFYVQDVLGGLTPTVHEVARASITSTSPTGFGQVRAVDNLVTAEPAYDSKTVGRVQGLITSADLETSAFAMNLNFYFTSGKYNWSNISILGRNQIGDSERELAVAGGTGVFRGARGYAITRLLVRIRTMLTSHGVLEYTLYVSYMGDSIVRLHADV